MAEHMHSPRKSGNQLVWYLIAGIVVVAVIGGGIAVVLRLRSSGDKRGKSDQYPVTSDLKGGEGSDQYAEEKKAGRKVEGKRGSIQSADGRSNQYSEEKKGEDGNRRRNDQYPVTSDLKGGEGSDRYSKEKKAEPVVFPTRIRDDVLWQVGKLNGKPADLVSLHLKDEFGVYRSETSPVTVDKLEQFPQILGARQTMIVSVGKLPKQHLVLKIVVHLSKPIPQWPVFSTGNNRFMRVEFNNKSLHNRWLSSSRNWVSVFLPAELVDKTQNMLVISNDSDEDWSFDAVWIQPGASNERVWLALSDAEWLNRMRAKHIPQMAMDLSIGAGTLEPKPFDTLIAKAKPETIAPMASRQRTWSQQPWSQLYHSLSRNADAQDHFRYWGRRIGNVLMRGAEPVVKLETSSSRPAWMPLFLMFRPYVRHWILDNTGKESLVPLVETMLNLAPEADISITHRRKQKVDPQLLRLATPSLHGGQLPNAEVFNQMRGVLAGNGAVYERSMSPLLLWSTLEGHEGKKSIRRRSVSLPAQAVTWLYDGGSKVYLTGGDRYGGVFPRGSREPTIIWRVLETMLPLARGLGKRVPSVLLAKHAERKMTDAAWCAVQNSDKQVTALIFAFQDAGLEGTFQCAVPWQGQTDVVFTALTLKADAAPSAVEMEPVTVQTSGTAGQATVSIPVKIANLIRITMTPAEAKPMRQLVLERKSEKSDDKPSHDENLAKRLDQFWDRIFWATSLADTQNPSDWVALGSAACSPIHATPAPFIDHKRKTLPWSSRSRLVRFVRPKEGDLPLQGVRIFLNRESFINAPAYELLVLPKSSKKRRELTLHVEINGKRYDKEALQPNRWNRVVISTAELSSAAFSAYLSIWPVEDEIEPGGWVSFEINQVLAVGLEHPENDKPSPVVLHRAGRYPTPGADDSTKKKPKPEEIPVEYLVLARPGQPVLLRHIFKMEQAPRRIRCDVHGLKVQYMPQVGVARFISDAFPDVTFVKDQRILDTLPLPVLKRVRKKEITAIQVSVWEAVKKTSRGRE